MLTRSDILRAHLQRRAHEQVGERFLRPLRSSISRAGGDAEVEKAESVEEPALEPSEVETPRAGDIRGRAGQ